MARARVHDVGAVAALLALLLAAAALLLSWQTQRTVSAAAERADERYERRLAEDVVFRAVDAGPGFAAPGEKPEVVGSADLVLNHGPYAVEDVLLHSREAGDDDPLPGIRDVLRIGSIEPCTGVAVDSADRVRIVFTDAEGRRWSRDLKSAPVPFVDDDVTENPLDIRSAPQPRRFPLPTCDPSAAGQQGDDG